MCDGIWSTKGLYSVKSGYVMYTVKPVEQKPSNSSDPEDTRFSAETEVME